MRRGMAGAGGALVLVVGLLPALAAPAQATPADDGLVIGEVYLNGGSSGATYLNKYVEIHNPTDADIDVSGWSVQYRSYSSTGTFTGVIALGEHHVEPGGALLVGATATPPTARRCRRPTSTSTIAFSGNTNGGTLALGQAEHRAGAATAPPCSADANLVDLVGYGSVGHLRGGAPAPRAYSVTASLHRAGWRSTPTTTPPTSAARADARGVRRGCDGGVVAPPDPPGTATIAEIQGPGAASPLATHRHDPGVVTAVYPTGGFSGAYVQTAGPAAARRWTGGVGRTVRVLHALAADVQMGDHVEVTGSITEYFGLTELVTAADDYTVLAEPVEAVEPTECSSPWTSPRRRAWRACSWRPGHLHDHQQLHDQPVRRHRPRRSVTSRWTADQRRRARARPRDAVARRTQPS